METVGQYGGAKVSVCGNDEAIDFVDLAPFRGKFRREPTTPASILSIRFFTAANRPTRGGLLFRQPRSFSPRSTKSSTSAYSKTSGEPTRFSLPSVACHPPAILRIRTFASLEGLARRLGHGKVHGACGGGHGDLWIRSWRGKARIRREAMKHDAAKGRG
uniref:Uncharacterized protein n=1 Tax=Picocystis salinarum TaxID=88271 RepID=A0A7S3XDT2_9CHLO